MQSNIVPNVSQRSTRNIKANYGWLWQEKAALHIIGEHYTGARLLAARSIYLALTEIASDQHTPTQSRAACSYIGTRAGVTEGTARRYLHELADLGLLAIDTAARDWNTYHLLAIDVPQDDDLAVATMVLADGKGISSAPPTQAETPTGAPLDMAKGITGAPQMKKGIPKTNKQTTTGMLVVPPVEIASATTTAADGVVGRLVRGGEEYVAATNPSSDVDEQRAVKALTGLGMRRSVAEKMAATCPTDDIIAWARYAQRQATLKSRAGFVLAMLRAKEPPPPPIGVTQQWYQKQIRPLQPNSSPTGGWQRHPHKKSRRPHRQHPPRRPLCNLQSAIQNLQFKVCNQLSTQHSALTTWRYGRSPARTCASA